MQLKIEERKKIINNGDIPVGYRKTDIGIIPQDWEELTVEESVCIQNELRTPISQQVRDTIRGCFPYYGPTQVQDYINTYNVEGPSVLIGEDGDHFLKYKYKEMTLYVEGKYSVNNHAHIIRGTNMCRDKWFMYFFQHRNLFDKITRQGAGRYKLTKEVLEKIKLAVPSMEEQDKVICVLQNYDKGIDKLQMIINSKKTQKKWFMQNLLTGKKRLQGFDQEWNDVKIEELIQEQNNRTETNNEYEILSVTKNGIVLQKDHFNKQIASEDNKGYKILKRGNLVFSTMNLWMGSVDVLDNYEIGIVSPAYKIFKFNEDIITPKFGKYFMKSSYMIWLYNINSEQGASIVRRNLDVDGVLKSIVRIPCVDEQLQIAKVLQTADKEIELLEKKLELIKQEKKAMMQLLLTGIVRVDGN